MEFRLPSLQTDVVAVAEDNGMGELTLDKKKKKKKKAAFVESVSPLTSCITMLSRVLPLLSERHW